MKRFTDIINEWRLTSNTQVHSDVYTYPYNLDEKTIKNICELVDNTVVKYLKKYKYLFGTDTIYPGIVFYVNIKDPDANIVGKYTDFNDNTLYLNCSIEQLGGSRRGNLIFYIALWEESRSHEIKDNYIKLLKELSSYDCEVLEVYFGTYFGPIKYKSLDDKKYKNNENLFYLDNSVNSFYRKFQNEIKEIDEECDDDTDENLILKLPISKKNQDEYEKLLEKYNTLIYDYIVNLKSIMK